MRKNLFKNHQIVERQKNWKQNIPGFKEVKFRQNKENRLFAISSLTICIFFLWNANSQKNTT